MILLNGQIYESRFSPLTPPVSSCLCALITIISTVDLNFSLSTFDWKLSSFLENRYYCCREYNHQGWSFVCPMILTSRQRCDICWPWPSGMRSWLFSKCLHSFETVQEKTWLNATKKYLNISINKEMTLTFLMLSFTVRLVSIKWCYLGSNWEYAQTSCYAVVIAQKRQTRKHKMGT